MPKGLDEFKQLADVSERHGGRKIVEGWDEVAARIQKAQLSFTVKEIWEHKELVNKRVGQYRTKNALDKLVEEGKLERKFDGKRFWYGPIEGGPNRNAKGAKGVQKASRQTRA